jgi:diacylglycerol O-acyltransferase
MTPPPRWPLGAIDLFHLRTHEELARERLGPNSCAMVAEVDGRLDPARVKARLARAARELPELGWRLGRDRRFERVWQGGGPGPSYGERRGGALLDDAVAILAEPVDGAAPWRVWLVHGPERDALVLDWYHAATDARGAARLLGWLGDEAAPAPDKRWMIADRLLEKVTDPEARELTSAYLAHAMELGRRPILSLQGAARGRAPGPQRAVRLRLGEDATRAFDASLRKRAGLADTSLMLWAAGRLVDRLLARRGFCPAQQLVPVPLSLDPKKGPARMFGNHLTMMMLALDRDDLGDEARAVGHLAEQRRDIVRKRLDVGMLAAIRSSRHIPRFVVDYLSRRPFGGERSSFVLSNPGAIEMGPLFGVPVVDAYAVPTLLSAPGCQIIADRFGGRLGFLFMVREGYASIDELAPLLPEFERDLLGR